MKEVEGDELALEIVEAVVIEAGSVELMLVETGLMEITLVEAAPVELISLSKPTINAGRKRACSGGEDYNNTNNVTSNEMFLFAGPLPR